MDIADRAQNAEWLIREQALACSGSAGSGESSTHCENCGEPIPEARRQAVPGCRYCVKCQTEMEQ